MAKKTSNNKIKKTVETITHDEASRKNIPTAEFQSVMRKEEQSPIRVAYERRNRELDPQLVWRGKDEKDWSELVVHAPPLYIQEKVHPKVLIDDLVRNTEKQLKPTDRQLDLFADFNGLPSENAKTEFYQHDANWSNRMILGDSLQVMASLAEREGLRGKVQCIYFDPPYGIKFNSNFQWSTTSRDVRDGNPEHITREPEQVKAFRDTWRDGIHSYLTYLRDRLTVARDLLTDTGSIFVQIGDENVHIVRSLLDEVFGTENFCCLISFVTTGGVKQNFLSTRCDYLLWYNRNKDQAKYRQLYFEKNIQDGSVKTFTWVDFDGLKRRGLTSAEKVTMSIPENGRLYRPGNITTQGNPVFSFIYQGKTYLRPWKTTEVGMSRMGKSSRLHIAANSLSQVNYLDDFPVSEVTALWTDTFLGSFAEDKQYIVQTSQKTIQRCILMTTDPGDLVLDPTCGSGSTTYVAEQWGRRWITIDTSRVALALARARIMGARYPYYLLADSRDGQIKDAEVTGTFPSEAPTHGNIRQGFVYERVPHITLKSIANNAEIDIIWENYQVKLEPLREQLNKRLKSKWQDWEVPRDVEDEWSQETKTMHAEWWKQRTALQKEIDASIAAKAEFEYLYDKPYEDNKKVRVAGPFTVESLSPHRVLSVDENDELIGGVAESKAGTGEEQSFVQMILENLKTSGVQQAHKEDKISFSSIMPWPGHFVCAEGRYVEGDNDLGIEKRAAIFIGPEFGTVARPDLVAAAREAGDADFDVLVTCAFNYDAHSAEFNKLGRIPVLKARMNADLHMADDLKNTGKGNLFVIFGEPDIEILKAKDDQIQIKINGVDVFHPNTGEVRSDGAEGIACWFIDTDYNEESFFVRHAYFLGANDPYKSLKTTLKAEINEEAWATLNSDTSRPFDKPQSGRIAVKVINHLGDEGV
jgi:adenine-specific DNA-methyltransferase